MANFRGIDVSSWQGTIDWEQVKADNIDFAMIRVGYGTSIDRLFRENIVNAQKEKIACGAYLYSVAGTIDEVLREAKYTLEAIRPYELQFPIAFDIEDKVHHQLTNSQRTDLADAFCTSVAQAGYHAMVYTSASWFNAMFDFARMQNFEKWVAHWSAERPRISDAAIWQYSNKGRVKGIQTDVDLNYAYKDFALLTPAKLEQSGVAVPLVAADVSSGRKIILKNAPIYASASALFETTRVSGEYWMYDGRIINNRIRITNRESFVNALPMARYVSGFVRIKDTKIFKN